MSAAISTQAAASQSASIVVKATGPSSMPRIGKPSSVRAWGPKTTSTTLCPAMRSPSDARKMLSCVASTRRSGR